MRKRVRAASVLALATALALALAACGGSSSSNSSSGGSSGGGSTVSSGGKQGGTITYLYGTGPDYLDPQEFYTTQGAETMYVSYTPLVTYAHASGEAGTKLIPGLATALPTVSKDGKTYTMTLRKGLVYSNGKPVKASDFAWTMQRLLKVNWGGKSFVTNYVQGAAAFDSGKAKSISGVTTDDKTGKITIKLVQPYGAFSNVLAFSNLGLVPTGSAYKNLSANPPPGVGPYMIKNVKVGKSWDLVKNPNWAKNKIPGVPSGHLDTIHMRVNSNTQSEAQQVLNNQADAFDPGDTLPPSLLPQIQRQASDRFDKQTIPSTFYFFLDVTQPPFNNIKAREAVNLALDRRAMVRLASGFLQPACYFLPEGLPGHPTSQCPSGDPNAAPNINKAKQLIQQAGLKGAKVTVWGEERSPRKQYVEYYADVLNKIGFKATPKIISDDVYFTTIGNQKTKAQTGFADWVQDFPNPSDFYLLLDARSIQPTNNQNFGNVNDPHIQKELAALNPVPATKLDSVADRWAKLDEYQAKKYYTLVYGSEQLPRFFSNKINFQTAVFHPLYLNDFTSLQLK